MALTFNPAKRLYGVMIIALLFAIPLTSNAQDSNTECLQITDLLYNRVVDDLKTGNYIGTVDHTRYTPEDLNYVTVSPDGKAVAYLLYQHDATDPSQAQYRYQLVIKPTNVINTEQKNQSESKGKPIILRKDVVFAAEPDPNAQWSPDSRWFADLWRDVDDRVYLILLDKTGQEVTQKFLFAMKSGQDSVLSLVGWSADSQYVAITTQEISQNTNTVVVFSIPNLTPVNTINSLPMANKAHTSDTNSNQFAFDGQWASSEHWLALLDGNARNAKLISLDSQKPIVDSFAEDTDVNASNAMQLWSPDGKHLAVALYHETANLWRVDILGTDGRFIQHISDKAMSLSFGEGGGGPSYPDLYWSPDGGALYFTEPLGKDQNLKSNLLVYNLNTHKTETIARDIFPNPQHTPGNEYLFYERSENDKTVLDVVDTTNEHRFTVPLSKPANSQIYGLYSPHSKALLIMERKLVVMVDTVHETSHLSNLSIEGLPLLTGGSRYAVSFNGSPPLSINLYTLDSGGAEKITLPVSADVSEDGPLAVSSDGAWLAFTAGSSDTERILILSRQGTVVQWIEDAPAVHDMAFVTCAAPSK